MTTKLPKRAKQQWPAETVHRRVLEALDNMPGFFAMADSDGVLHYLNATGGALLRLPSRDAAIGRSLSEWHAPAMREQLTKMAMPAAARDGSWSGESILLACDGTQIRIALVLVAHHEDDGRLAGYSAHARDITDSARMEEALRAAQVETHRLAGQHLGIQEAERRRIAADLHDGLGQSLSLVKLGIQEALRQMGTDVPQEAVETVRQLKPKVEGALEELHRVAMDLRPSTLDDLGILPTLSWFVREFESVNLKTRIEKHIGVNEKDVPEPLKIAIFRILQEAVNNAVKYSDADRIRISLQNGGDTLAFTIEDDGKGFDPTALTGRHGAKGGLGLQSMKERAEVSGGSYAVTSAVGQGTKVCVWWPATKAADGYRDRPGCPLCGVQSGSSVDGLALRSCYCTHPLNGTQIENTV